ncbi:hypothetical protein ACFQL0_18730 [Haloplanus litoreus]|uniref:hypothetical protein n=1 Tax=Haloplanus litoreus TaxID=767515 RepID=UPI00361233AF
MRVREFPVLGDEDERVVEAFAAGLDREAARVLAYLVGREDSDRFSGEAASRLAVRVGVDLGRGRVSDVLSTLTDRELITETTVESEAPGRPRRDGAPTPATTRRSPGCAPSTPRRCWIGPRRSPRPSGTTSTWTSALPPRTGTREWSTWG